MKHLLILLIFLFSNSVISQNHYLDKNGNKHFWGNIQPADLQKEGFKEWYHKSIENYTPQTDERVNLGMEGVDVLIYLGTWCGDSKNWVPKFIKKWESMNLSLDRLKMVAVHNQDEVYKQAPDRSEVEHNLHRVPTFVFSRNGKEIGKIVESPVNSLDTDIAQISLGIPSEPNYKAVAIIDELLQVEGIDSVTLKDSVTYSKIYRMVTYPGELNTYAKKLFYDGKKALAIEILEINTRIFPYEPFVYNNLGKYYLKEGQREKARECFIRSLQLDLENVFALEQLADLM
jgi:tetratricopeptide (TPR) repeat protein